MDKKTILIVEDEYIVAEAMRMRLTAKGYDVLSNVASGEEAIGQVVKNAPDLILMDIILNGRIDEIETA